MAGIKYVLSVAGADGRQPIKAGDTRENLERLSRMFKKLASGSIPVTYTVDARYSATAASGTVTISSGSGSITATINGVAVAVTWATSDTNSGDLLAAAINASSNALVKNIVTAANVAGVVTITAVVPGVTGNCITLAASGTGATASGARLTGGAETVEQMSC